MDKDWARKALGDWFKTAANVRQMHSPMLGPAGKGIELEEQPDGFWLTSKVINPEAVRYVDEGVYTGYSIGIKDGRKNLDGKAAKGRWVDGKIPEVSLVDRPANPTCLITVAKAVGWEPEDAAKALNGTPTADPPDGVAHTEMLDHTHPHDGLNPHSHPHLHDGANPDHDGPEHSHKTGSTEAGKVDAPLAFKRDYSQAQRNEMAANGHAKPDGSFPIETREDVINAVHDWGRAGSSASDKTHIIKRARAIGALDALPDDWSAKGIASAERTFIAKRLHDLTCPAYDPQRLSAVYPSVQKDGVAGALGSTAKGMLYAMLAQEVAEDGGSGSEADDVHAIAGAYYKLCCFLGDEASEPDEDYGQAMLAARADLHAAFKAANGIPSLPDGATDARLPSPSDPPQPGQFRRPYLTAGHARENANTTHDARLPQANPDSAEAHTRGPLTDGQERESPGDSAQKMQHDLLDLHDWLSSIVPTCCPMQAPELRAASVPQNTNPPAETPSPGAWAGTPGAPGISAIKAESGLEDSIKAAVAEAVGQQVTAILGEQAEKMAELERAVAELSRQPDPYRDPIRGMAGLPVLAGSEAMKGDGGEAQKRAQRAELQADLRYYQGLLASGDVRYREVALRREEETRQKLAGL